MNKKGQIAMFLAIIFVAVILLGVASAKPGARGAKACDDGLDNDGDGYIDYPDDPGCDRKTDKSELNSNIECDDGSDNDGDGDVDTADGGCSGPTDDDETNCGDGVCEGGETSGTCPADCGYPDSCSDTDGGNYILTFGTASGYFNNIYYSDDDYCVDTSNIMEYYCSGDYEQSQQQSCGTDVYGSPYCTGDSIYKDFTDYYCASGACDSDVTPTFQENCNDNDGYGSNYCSSGDVYHDYYNYYCTGGACDYTTTPELVEDCIGAETCVGGECVIPDSCTDSDGGWDPWNYGNTSGYLNESFYLHIDYCLDASNVREWYCSGDYEYYSDVWCNMTGCSGGACN